LSLNKMQLEIIVTNVQEAILAQEYGADRLELIHAFSDGGLSPDKNLAQEVCAAVSIPVNIMVRPHASSFTYNPIDVKQIITELDFLREQTKANAIVFGALTQDKNIDEQLLQLVIATKGRLDLTFHRAMDEAHNTLDACSKILKYAQVSRILTSGGGKTVIEGLANLRAMTNLAQNTRCQILPGSGITLDNIKSLLTNLSVAEIHIGTGVRTNNQLDKLKFKQFKQICK
jgi:copper homeostasis protein